MSDVPQQYHMLEWLFGKRKEEAPQKPKPSAQQQAEDKWKYDFLVQFLSGPLWKTSILDFVDYHCVVFDSEEENKFEYTTIHNKFKELVASLFDSMIQEVGLDDDKLAELLEKGFESKHKKIFNQLLLADDFVRFKTLMVNRNKSLEAEAIKALSEKSQDKPHVEQKPGKKGVAKEEDLLKESKRLEEERRKKQEQQEEQELRKVIEMSRLEAEESAVFKKMEAKAEENEIRQSQLPKESPKVEKQQHEVEAVSSHNERIPAKEPPKLQDAPVILPPVRRRKKVEESPKLEKPEEKPEEKVEEKPVVHVHVPAPIPEQKAQEPVEQSQAQSQEERKKRLLQQREKIRKRKEEQRKKQMAEQQSKPAARHVQTIVLQEDGIHETQLRAPEQQKKEKVNNEELERRRELMRKIKNRIVDDF